MPEYRYEPEVCSFKGWFMHVTNWRVIASPVKKSDGSRSEDFVVQFLSGKKLQPGREYFIWFGSDTNQPIEPQAALRFVPSGSINPNNPGELVKGLGVPLNGETSYHRHFCLGAIH